MPHDKNGNILAIGDRITLACIVTAIFAGEEQCNITTEAAERPEGEGYVPQISGNSRFYEKLLPAPAQKIVHVNAEPRAYLYIEGFGPMHPSLFTNSREPFNFDEKLAVHVKRFASNEEFTRDAKRIMAAQTGHMKIFAGVEIVETLPEIPGGTETSPSPIQQPPIDNAYVEPGAETFSDTPIPMAGAPENQPPLPVENAKSTPKRAKKKSNAQTPEEEK